VQAQSCRHARWHRAAARHRRAANSGDLWLGLALQAKADRRARPTRSTPTSAR
jgi:hypothetical protein